MKTSRIRILSGLSQGRTIDLPDTDEVIHLGKSPDNEVVVEDPALMPRHASFAQRHGRYAVYVFEADDVQLDDLPVPPGQWVWLPAVARLRLTDATTIVLESALPVAEQREAHSDSAGDGLPATAGAPGAVAAGSDHGVQQAAGRNAMPPPSSDSEIATPRGEAVAGQVGREPPPPESPVGADASAAARPHGAPRDAATTEASPNVEAGEVAADRKGGTSADRDSAAADSQQPSAAGRNVARFVADRQPAHVIRLGEDGRLPEFHLATEGEQKAGRTGWSGSSALLYFVLGLSMVSSTALLLVDAPNPAASADRQAQVRRSLRQFYEASGDLQPYQKLLLEASLAHERGDHRAEREAYLKVLALLNAEDKNPFLGVTGSLSKDAELRRLITAALEE